MELTLNGFSTIILSGLNVARVWSSSKKAMQVQFRSQTGILGYARVPKKHHFLMESTFNGLSAISLRGLNVVRVWSSTKKGMQVHFSL